MKLHKKIGGGVLKILLWIALILMVGLYLYHLVSPTPIFKGVMEYFNRRPQSSSVQPATTTESKEKLVDGQVYWQFDGVKWQPLGTPPACKNPIVFDKAPVNVNMVTSVLYPGQTRGGNYKPHGGFRFDGHRNDDVKVVAPMDGNLLLGSRYIESGEVQYLLFFVNSCGIAYRFDHLLTLAPAIQQLAETLPEPKVDDSRTTRFTPIPVKAGDTIATAVGFSKSKNVGFDFGVYDLRQPNAASKDPAYAKAHASEKEQAFYAVCWFNYFPGYEPNILKALPGSGTEGKTSDYCK